MSDFKYLQDEQHYIDRYDLHTIEECLDTVKMFQDIYQKSLASEELKDISEKDKLKDANIMLHRTLFVIKGKRYEKKKETVQKWMEEDKLKQDKQDYTPTPQGIKCPLCKGSMFFNSSKHLEYSYDSPIMRMMFLFKCTDCQKQQWVYDDGEIRVSEPDLCPKCNKELDVTGSRKGKVITTLYKCKKCNYSKKDILDLAKRDEEHKKWQEEQKKKEEVDKKLLEKYRKEFCLSDEEGKEYVETLEAMEVAHEVHEEEKRKYDTTAYQTAMHLKQVNIADLEKLLTEAVEKEKYVKFTLEKPEMGQQVIIPFNVLDAVSTRRQNISEDTLKKLIKDTLESTNWRLMSDGIHYRLGYLSGRLRAYESEEDLVQLSGKVQEQEPISKLDPEKRAKYNYHNLVQLARMTGKQAGIDSLRKKRLKHEPKGFFLEAGEGPYTCAICRENHYGNEIWWTEKALYCKDCWKNIKEGVIPPLEYDNDNKVWIKDWQIKSEYSVQPGTRKKLERQGVLHPRILKRLDGSIYCTVYLIKENQEFLKQYPPKPEMDIKFEWSKEKKGLILHANKINYSKASQEEIIVDKKGTKVKL